LRRTTVQVTESRCFSWLFILGQRFGDDMEGQSYVSVAEHNMLKEKVNVHEVRNSIAETTSTI